jgi:hypothetical protein
MILDALKKRLYSENKKAPNRWLKELLAVVWGLRTQPSRNTGVFPYFMVYDAEASSLLTSLFDHQGSRTSTKTGLMSHENLM